MGNIENTAVNELITRATGGPRATSPSARMAAAIPPPLDSFQRDPGHTTLPVKMPVAAPFETTLPMAYPMVPRALLAPGTGRAAGVASTPPGGQAVAAAEPAWPPRGPGEMERLDPRRLYELMHQRDHERMVLTFQMRRRSSEVRSVVSRLVFPIALLVSIGIVIGAYVAFGDHGKSHGEVAAAREPSTSPPAATETAASLPPDPAPVPAASAPAVAPAPAAAPAPVPAAAAEVIAAPAMAAAAAPSLVDVRLESIPSGATVSLVDRGRTQLVGDTPIDTAVDPAREYDLVFTYADKPPHVEHLDARATRRISAVLDAPEPPARPVDSAPRHPERAGREGRESARSRPSRARAEAVGDGTLMISSKPPCEIVIDGRATGLTTPQRSIALAAGRHRITLLNSEKAIKKALTVQIVANTTEKVIEDLMK